MNHPKTLVIGGGLCGLSYAHHKKESLVIEQHEFAGGMATSTERDGFIFDHTGHWLHLKDPSLRAWIFEKTPDLWQNIKRRASIYSHNTYTPFPFQANTHGLPVDVVSSCVLGFFEAREKRITEPRTAQNFEDYMRRQMGDGITEHFMLPYNRKLWQCEPKEMSHAWCARFVPQPSPEEVVLGAITPTAPGQSLGYNSSFWYPKRGGISELSKALVVDLPKNSIRMGNGLRTLDLHSKVARLENGDKLDFEHLVSTMPLTKLLDLIDGVPESVLGARKKLRANSTCYANVGVRGEPVHRDHWIYVPESEFPFYRVGSPSAVSSHLSPPGSFSFYVEWSARDGENSLVSEADVWDGLRRMGLVNDTHQPMFCDLHRLSTAYVLMDQDYGEARETCLSWLLTKGVHSVGRYGAWTYDSMEGAMLAGRDLALSHA